MEVSREIRKLYPEPVIIFITNYADYAIEAYEVNTFRYIPKSRLERKLSEAYDALFPMLMEKKRKILCDRKEGDSGKACVFRDFLLEERGEKCGLCP